VCAGNADGQRSVRDRLLNFAWALGVRAFRLARKANFSATLEPTFAALAGLVPTPARDVVASLPSGAKLLMPAGYRDTRTVVTGLFQRDETKLLELLARPRMTFLDIGAYVGYFTVLASGWVGATGRVYAFEPDTLAYGFLLRNIEANDCGNVVPINKAVSDGVKTAMLVRDPKGPETFLAIAPAEGDSAVPVQTLTLDSFLESEKWPSVDLAKMNIEGSELLALSGMKEVSRRNPGLRLVMEFNPAAMERSAVSREHLTATLKDLGFRRGQVVERDLEWIPPGELLPTGSAVYNVLLTK
jgi:FkbM family methyltransferase